MAAEPTRSSGEARPPPTPTQQKPQQPPSPERSRTQRKQSFGFPESDPWASPELHRGHNHQNTSAGASQTNGLSFPTTTPVRTTSDFTTHSEQPEPVTQSNHVDTAASTDVSEGGWGGSFGTSPGGGFSGSGIGGEGFGAGGDGGNGGAGGLGRPISSSRLVNNAIEEVVTVTTLPEKEGVFLFQHRNYQVASSRKNSKVVRRYSDFVWLLDCLQKKYPFRQLPLLPPKSVAGKHCFKMRQHQQLINYSKRQTFDFGYEFRRQTS